MSVKVVNSGPGVIKVSVETTPAITVTSPEVSPVEVTAGLQGETGPQGATGPQGPAGSDGTGFTGGSYNSSTGVVTFTSDDGLGFSTGDLRGADGTDGTDGQGVPSGGDQYQVLRKASGTDYDTEWSYSDRVTIEVRFDEAVSKGDPLYVTGYSNGQNRITVAKADASDSSKMPSIGLAFSDYSQNDNGQVTTIGSLEDIDTQVTNDFQEGDVIYVASGGGLTNVKPTGTNLIQNVGKVGRRQQNNGEIVVMAIGRSNDVPNIPNGQAWIGNASGVATPTTLATVATSGSYTDLSDKPTIPTDTNLGNSDQTLSAERTIELSGNALVIDNNSAEVARIFPNGYIRGTQRVIVDGNGLVGGEIRLNDADSSNYVKLIAPTTVSSDLSFTLPDSDGSSGQVLKTDGSGNLSFGDDKITQLFNLNFFDDISTLKHYLPWKDINEQSQNYQDESAMLMPYDGRIVSISLKVSFLTADGDITLGIESIPTGSSPYAFPGSWTIEETETLSATSTDDHHTFHFVFDNASHFEAGDTVAISIQTSADIMGNSYIHATAVVEFDTSGNLGSSSTEHDSNP